MLIFNLTNENLPFENANSISTYRTLLYMLLLKLTKIIIGYTQLISPLQGDMAACGELYSSEARSGYSNSVYAKQKPYRTVSDILQHLKYNGRTPELQSETTKSKADSFNSGRDIHFTVCTTFFVTDKSGENQNYTGN